MFQKPTTNTPRFILAILAYLVPTFPLGFVWHLKLFHEQYQQLQLYRQEVIIPLGVAAMLTQGIVYAWLYPLINRDQSSWLRGTVRFFLPVMLLAWSFTTLPVAAKYQMTSITNFMWLESSFTVIQFLVVSPLIALVYHKA